VLKTLATVIFLALGALTILADRTGAIPSSVSDVILVLLIIAAIMTHLMLSRRYRQITMQYRLR